jgi:L-seryl-tRNA(Ser) seleniumtransferase
MIPDSLQDSMRRIPAVDQLLLRPKIAHWVASTSRAFVVSEIQKLLHDIRSAIRSGEGPGQIPEDFDDAFELRLQIRLRPALRVVVNATGVILHTNLGRAPLSSAAQTCLSAYSGHYTNLEFDLERGERSQRDRLVEPALAELLGCESAIVVNNNAAAVFLILNTLACGREVVVSRGELIEIGGSFRIPDIMSRSGARLREVGTTNRTRPGDYEAAIGPETAIVMRIHPSNYRIRGFTGRPTLDELVGLTRKYQLPLVEDIGSGCLIDLRPYGVEGEPVAQDSLAAGADLVCFSADKLLGGPQAGIIAGRRKLVELTRKNPLMRALRVGKLIYGALETTLASYRTGRALEEIPVLRMISMEAGRVRERARLFVRRSRTKLPEGATLELIDGQTVIGGGSCPDCTLPTTLLALATDRKTPNQIESLLRSQEPPILIRIDDKRAVADLRTVLPEQEPILLAGICRALA